LLQPALSNDADHEACVEMFSVLHAAQRELLVPATVVAEVGYLPAREADAVWNRCYLFQLAFCPGRRATPRRRQRRAGERHDGDTDSIANEFQRQPGHDKGREKDRQEPLSGASEGDDLVLGGVEGLSAARVSSIANLQGVTSRLDRHLDRVVHFDRPDPITVDHDIVRATTDLRSDCLMRQLQRRRHLLISSCF
jgi:hypothetical protein